MTSQILLQITEHIATITLSNPDKLNAINLKMWHELHHAVETATSHDDVRCIILRGEGDKAFAAGGDIEEFLQKRVTEKDALHYHEEGVAKALNSIRNTPHPTIAAISGACIGGGLEIAVCCNLRIAGESARFGVPINKLGFSMYPNEMACLLDIISPAVLLEILLEGRFLGAAEALQKGILSRVVPDEAVFQEAQESAARIAAGAPLVARWHKQWIHRLMNNPTPLSDEEKQVAFAFLQTKDYHEGISAFMEKRPPRFKGC